MINNQSRIEQNMRIISSKAVSSSVCRRQLSFPWVWVIHIWARWVPWPGLEKITWTLLKILQYRHSCCAGLSSHWHVSVSGHDISTAWGLWCYVAKNSVHYELSWREVTRSDHVHWTYAPAVPVWLSATRKTCQWNYWPALCFRLLWTTPRTDFLSPCAVPRWSPDFFSQLVTYRYHSFACEESFWVYSPLSLLWSVLPSPSAPAGRSSSRLHSLESLFTYAVCWLSTLPANSQSSWQGCLQRVPLTASIPHSGASCRTQSSPCSLLSSHWPADRPSIVGTGFWSWG